MCIRDSNMGYATLFEVSMAKGLITDRAFVPVQCSMPVSYTHLKTPPFSVHLP